MRDHEMISVLFRKKRNISTDIGPPWWNPPWRGGGAYLTKRFPPSASTSRTRQSDAATFDKDKQICFMLMPRTWFKVEEFRLE